MDPATILIIDDDLELAETLKTVLVSSGYEVLTAPDSDEGMEAARREKPDLIILDVMMRTRGEGISAARSFKDDPELGKIPVIMMTSVEKETGFSFDPETDGDYLPVDTFLSKPVDPARLLREIDNLL